MDNEKSTLIREIQGMMGGTSYQKSSYNSLTVSKTVDKLLVRLGIAVIIGLLGFIIMKDFFKNRSCKTR